MSIVRVNPASVHAYSAEADAAFAELRSRLTALVNESVGVNYKGENSVLFKTRCGQMCSNFAEEMNSSIARIGAAISSATSAIAGSLGGGAITLSLNTAPVAVPAVPPADGVVELDTSGLSSFGDSASAHFSTISGLLDRHVSALSATDWVGNSKETALSQVQGFTAQAQSSVASARSSLLTAVNEQIAATLAADA